MNHFGRRIYGLTASHANAAMVAGTTSTYTTTVSTACTINGKWATVLTAQTNTASPTTDINTGVAFPAIQPGFGACFVWGLNAAGAVKVCKGPSLALTGGVTTTPGTFDSPPQFPLPPADFCPVAYTIITTGPSAAAWVFGTGTWTASGVVATFQNIATMPDRPQAS